MLKLGGLDSKLRCWRGEPAVRRVAAGHRQHGAVSVQPVRRDDQRPGHQRGWRDGGVGLEMEVEGLS